MWKGFLSAWFIVSSTAAWAFAPYEPGEVVVKLKPVLGVMGMSAQVQTKSLLGTLKKRYAASVHPFRTDSSLVTVKVTDKISMKRLLTDIKANPQVQYAEPNFIYHTLGAAEPVIPSDPNFALNWGLLNTGQKDSKGQVGIPGVDIGATKAWELGLGSKEIVVAVIDTGVDYNHEDLKDNIWTNTKEISGNAIDDDGNGFVDDIHGWNFHGKTPDPMDDNSHGTHCSGTIGAQGGNGIGTAGVNFHVSIVPIKFLSAQGSGSLDDAVEAIKYATKLGVNVMSNSWGGGGFSQTMMDAIKEAKEKGILFVAAAGNEGNDNDASPSYPASYDLDNVISVAATDNRDIRARWSNYGQTKVHLAAPGVNIYSTIPTTLGGYDTFSGTSMACPHVAGAAALLWSQNRGMAYGDIKARLLATVDPVRTLARKTSSGGRLSINNALRNIVPVRIPPPTQWKSMAKVVESEHPYKSDITQVFEITHPGAKHIRVHFAKLQLETGYDFITIQGNNGELIDELTGNRDGYTTDYVDGDKITITLTSDSSNELDGFLIDKYEFID